MKVKTKVGEIDALEPNQVGPRVKFWAEALHELARVDEVYGVLGAALKEAYEAGRRESIISYLQGFGSREVVDVPFEVLDEKRSDVAGDREGRGNQGELAEAAAVGSAAPILNVYRQAESQADGDPGGETRTDGEGGAGPVRDESIAEREAERSPEHPFTD